MTNIFDRQFWLIGIMFLAMLVVIIVWRFTESAQELRAVQTNADRIIRDTFPDLVWAFDEWERCSAGAGTYARDGYRTRHQCVQAVIDQAARHGDASRLRAAILQRDRIIDNELAH